MRLGFRDLASMRFWRISLTAVGSNYNYNSLYRLYRDPTQKVGFGSSRWGLGFRAQGLGFRVAGLRFGV